MSDTLPQDMTAKDLLYGANGFDDIATKKAFSFGVKDAPDGASSLRVALFLQHRRNGANDTDAYQQAMTATFGDLMERFSADTTDDDLDRDPYGGDEITPIREWARFILATGYSVTLPEFLMLTFEQRAAFAEELDLIRSQMQA